MASLETYIEKYSHTKDEAKVGQCDLKDLTSQGLNINTYSRLIDPRVCMDCPVKRMFNAAMRDTDLHPTETTALARIIKTDDCLNPFILSQAEGPSEELQTPGETPKRRDTIGAMYARNIPRKGSLIN